jgi:hypothetical protein
MSFRNINLILLVLLLVVILISGCTNAPVRKHLMCDRVAAKKIKILHAEGKTQKLNILCNKMGASAVANLEALGGPLPNVVVDEDNVEKKYDEAKKDAENQGMGFGWEFMVMIAAMVFGTKYGGSIIKILQFIGHKMVHIKGFTTGKNGKYDKGEKDEVAKS